MESTKNSYGHVHHYLPMLPVQPITGNTFHNAINLQQRLSMDVQCENLSVPRNFLCLGSFIRETKVCTIPSTNSKHLTSILKLSMNRERGGGKGVGLGERVCTSELAFVSTTTKVTNPPSLSLFHHDKPSSCPFHIL